MGSIAQLLVGRTPDRWDERTLAQFDRQFIETVHRIEEAALSVGEAGGTIGSPDAFAGLIVSRIDDLYGRLGRLVGGDRAKKEISKLVGSAKEQEQLWPVSAKL